jgi:glycosyltransferase involved in cell wall biosynthesis
LPSPEVALRARRKAVLLVTHEHSTGEASLRYRSLHHAESLRFLGVTCDVFRFGVPGLLETMEEYECIVLHRVPWEDAEPVVHRARERGKVLVSDTDDLVFDPDSARHIEAIAAMSDEWREAWSGSFRKTIEACTGGATASTEPLARHLATVTGPVEVLPNVANDELIRLAERARSLEPGSRGGEVTIAYLSGSLTHRGDFEEAAGAVLWALETYPQARFTVVGNLELDRAFERFESRVERIPWHPWQALPELQARTDVNLAPLAANPFCECKSHVKYLEAALVGVPTIASTRGDFPRVIEHGWNGLLAGDAAGWRDALGRLLEDPALRRRLGERAHEDVRANHTTRARLAAVERLWVSVTRTRRPEEQPLTLEWLLGPDLAAERVENVVRLARGLAEHGHTVRLCAEPRHGPEESRVVRLLERNDVGRAEPAIDYFVELGLADARIATDALTSYILSYQDSALFRFRLVQDLLEVGFEAPVRLVALGAALAESISKRAGGEVVSIEPGDGAPAELDRFLRTACFVRLGGPAPDRGQASASA